MEMCNTHILIVEDDEALIDGLKTALTMEDYKISHGGNITEAKQLLGENNFDLIILDLGLPDGSGLEILKFLKNESMNVPVLILSARSGELDKVIGLESGADDFVSKPFSLRELLARIKAVLRRSHNTKQVDDKTVYSFEELKIDFESREIFVDDIEIELSFTEFQIIDILVKNINNVISREKLLNKIWKGDFIDHRSIDPHISRLRKKLKKYGKCIKTVPNIGYKFKI